MAEPDNNISDYDGKHYLDHEITQNINFLRYILDAYVDIREFKLSFEDIIRDNKTLETNQNILRDACLLTKDIKEKKELKAHDLAKEALFLWCLVYCEGVLSKKYGWSNYNKDMIQLATHDAVMNSFKALRDGINAHFENNPDKRFRGTNGRGIRAYLSRVMENAYIAQQAGQYTRVRVDENDTRDFEKKTPAKIAVTVEISEDEAYSLIDRYGAEVISKAQFADMGKTELAGAYRRLVVKEEIFNKFSSGARYFKIEMQSQTKPLELKNENDEIYTDPEVTEYIINSTVQNAGNIMASEILDSVIDYMAQKGLLSDLELEFLNRVLENNEKDRIIQADWEMRGINYGSTIGNFKRSLIGKITKELGKNPEWQELAEDYGVNSK